MKPAVFVAIILYAVLDGSTVSAKQPSIAGTWTFTVEQAGMEFILFERDGTVSGTLDWPHGSPIKFSGGLAGGTLRFSGDSSGENYTLHIDSAGSIKEDGTLAGTLNAHFVDFNDVHEVIRTIDQEIPWTAMRGYVG
jgi:hypothetical protein